MAAYDELAESWHAFRRKPFPPIVEAVAKDWHGRILDVGCGNARNLLVFDGELTGVDDSRRMLDFARASAAEQHKKAVFLLADARRLPFKEAHFDHVLCVAMLHHLTLDDQRIALQEIKRVLKPDGKALLTFWNKWQGRFIFGKTERMIPWTSKGKTVERYYFLHNRFSASKLVKKAGLRIERTQGLFGRNVVFVVSA